MAATAGTSGGATPSTPPLTVTGLAIEFVSGGTWWDITPSGSTMQINVGIGNSTGIQQVVTLTGNILVGGRVVATFGATPVTAFAVGSVSEAGTGVSQIQVISNYVPFAYAGQVAIAVFQLYGPSGPLGPAVSGPGLVVPGQSQIGSGANTGGGNPLNQ